MNMGASFRQQIKILLIITTFLLTLAYPLYPGYPAYKTREIINYQMSFSQQSNVTLVVTSCGALLDLRQTVLSFFYYNTYPLRKMILVDRCFTPEVDLKNCLPSYHEENSDWYKIVTFAGAELEALQKAFELVQTKYVVLYANKWITFDGHGFIEQAIDAIEYGQKNNIKISQVTTLYPIWKNYRSLSRYTKTPAGTKFYQIRSFKPAQRYYFTFNPSLINFDVVYKKMIGRSISQYCADHNCQGNNIRECFELELGKQLYEANGYFQAYIDDGSIQAKVFFVQK